MAGVATVADEEEEEGVVVVAAAAEEDIAAGAGAVTAVDMAVRTAAVREAATVSVPRRRTSSIWANTWTSESQSSSMADARVSHNTLPFPLFPPRQTHTLARACGGEQSADL